MTCTIQMRQGSTHTMQLNAVPPLTVERVTAMTLEIFSTDGSGQTISKTLGDGIETLDDGWMVTISGEELSFSGYVARKVTFISDALPYVLDLGAAHIVKLKP